jgi:hypothetical protein
MKEKELREHAKCSKCGKGIGHTGLPLFWTADIKRHGIDAGALRRNAGLSMFLGNAALASIMGPDEEMTREIENRSITLCEDCAFPLMGLLDGCPGPEEVPGTEPGALERER